ncbi:heat shock factor protein 5 [Cyrtonyx montezumae]|uniref:heat shock factor protein 5 n=1 Tax=Cyrtonyx montezumae TaxID=9017 RepID=UPI0032DB9954
MAQPQPPVVSVDPNNFPAKLWWLVNSPRIRSVCWDALGEGLLIEQPLFEAEVLGRWGGDEAVGELFKSSKFSSFIRQLNLYGFRKQQTSREDLHHYHSPHFQRDRPELLGRLKRLTRANRAKAEAAAAAGGLDVGRLPPNRSRFPTVSSVRAYGTGKLRAAAGRYGRAGGRAYPQPSAVRRRTDGSDHGEAGMLRPLSGGLLDVGQFCEPYQQLPCSYVSASLQKCSILSPVGLEQNPGPSRTPQNSQVLLPEHNAPPAFPDMGVAFPVFHRLPTEVMYTPQPNFSLVLLQQVSQDIATSSAVYSSCVSPQHYTQAYYPTAALPCCSLAAHTGPLTCCVSPTAPNYTQCSFYQGPPMQTPYVAESLPSNQPYQTSDESQMTEVDLESVFQLANEMSSLPKPAIAKVNLGQEELSSLQSNRDQPLLDDSKNDHQPSDEERRLGPHTTVVSDIMSLVVGEGVACSLLQLPEYLYTFDIIESVECAAAQTVREPVAMEETQAKLSEEPDHLRAPSSAVYVQEVQPFSPQKVDTSVGCEFLRSESEEVGCFTSGAGPEERSVENRVSSVQANNGEERNSSQGSNFRDFHLLVDLACKQESVPEEETRE